MRWLYADKNNPQEKDRIIAAEEKILRWWRAFSDKQAEIIALLQNETQFDLAAWMKDNLNCIEENLMWEFRPGHTKPYRLVISSQRDKSLTPYIAYMLSLAPELDDWEFNMFLTGQNFDKAADFVSSKIGVGIGDIAFKVDKGEHNTIELTFTAADDKEKQAALMTLELVLGEEIASHWISKVNFVPPAKKTFGLFKKELKGFFEMEDLKFEASEHVQDIVEDILPQEPFYKMEFAADFDSCKWSVFKSQPKDNQGDYPYQTDLAVGISCSPEIFQAAHSTIPFFSNRFSKFDEQFCYLKIEGNDKLGNCTFADYKELEAAMQKNLASCDSGCVIGGGTGLKYSYVELAIADINKAIPDIKKMLIEAKIPNKTWLLFHDADKRDEWIGIYDDTPEPPTFIENEENG